LTTATAKPLGAQQLTIQKFIDLGKFASNALVDIIRNHTGTGNA